MHMAAVILRHRTRRDRLRAAEAEELRRLVGERPGLPERLRSGLIAAIDRETASENGWTFVMLSPEQNRAVLDWLLAHSSRPRQAVALWARLFEHMRRDTGEIALTRDELAEELGVAPPHVSRLMGELEGIGAISRRLEKIPGMRGRGRAVYFMNPNVATNLAGAARDKAQGEAPPLRLVEPAGR
jgi:CRP-like cAMP-binding protein